MWLFVFFDLPTETKLEKKAATKFRKHLLDNGFHMYQYSIYLRSCGSREHADVHSRRVRASLPLKGKVSILPVTDRQFKLMRNYFGRKTEQLPSGYQQLEFF
jgi:CRISPR-associated protein Cas2